MVSLGFSSVYNLLPDPFGFFAHPRRLPIPSMSARSSGNKAANLRLSTLWFCAGGAMLFSEGDTEAMFVVGAGAGAGA